MGLTKSEVKLKTAAEEIKVVLRKHNLAGAVSLHTPGHGEFFVHMHPSYSCAYQTSDQEIRFWSKSKDYKTAEEQQRKQSDTSNMLNILMNITAINFGLLEDLSNKFDFLTNAKHF